MNTTEQGSFEQPTSGSLPSGSSVSLWRTNGGRPRWSVRVAVGEPQGEVSEAARIAVETDAMLTRHFVTPETVVS